MRKQWPHRASKCFQFPCCRHCTKINPPRQGTHDQTVSRANVSRTRRSTDLSSIEIIDPTPPPPVNRSPAIYSQAKDPVDLDLFTAARAANRSQAERRRRRPWTREQENEFVRLIVNHKNFQGNQRWEQIIAVDAAGDHILKGRTGQDLKDKARHPHMT